MMKLFTVFDSVAERYMKPFWGTNIASAIRGFADACKDPESPFFDHVEDYFLYQIATFDEVTGEVVALVPHKIASGNSFAGPRVDDMRSAMPIQLEVDKVNSEGRA